MLRELRARRSGSVLDAAAGAGRDVPMWHDEPESKAAVCAVFGVADAAASAETAVAMSVSRSFTAVKSDDRLELTAPAAYRQHIAKAFGDGEEVEITLKR